MIYSVLNKHIDIKAKDPNKNIEIIAKDFHTIHNNHNLHTNTDADMHEWEDTNDHVFHVYTQSEGRAHKEY